MSDKQPESVEYLDDSEYENFHTYLDGDEGEDFHRGGATPGGLEYAIKAEDFLECEDPQDEFSKIGPQLLEEALKAGHNSDDVTNYHIKGLGGLDQVALLFVVEYHEENNFETEAVAESKSASSPGF